MRKLVFVALAALQLCGCSSAPENPWAKITTPAPGPARAIGRPGAGCIAGAETLASEGVGYHAVHLERRRFFGHPMMIEFLRKMGEFARSSGFPVLNIGDIGMARGGPMPSGHSSHQIGLDADIWFDASARSVVVGDRLDRKSWGHAQEALLRKAVSFDEVDRIFVNPVIKRDLCARDPYKPWLHKLRPWWGHDDHWHVRLKCPASDHSCVAIEAIPPGAGCDATLDWWFSEEAKKKGEEPSKREFPKLPAECSALLSD